MLQTSDTMARGLRPSAPRIHLSVMVKRLFNLPTLGDPSRRERFLAWFLDGYAQSLDVYPDCRHLARQKDAGALWQDFVKVAEDMRNVTSRIDPEPGRSRDKVSDG